MTRTGFLLLVLPLAGLSADGEERRIFDAINRERERRGVNKLRWSEKLAEAAREHSRNMAQEGFFAHEDPRRGDLGNRLRQSGISYTACAENIYTQSGGRDVVASACRAWMQSSGHKKNILSMRYERSAIGVARNSAGVFFATQIFTA